MTIPKPQFTPSSSAHQFGALIGDYSGRPGYRLATIVVGAACVLLGVVGNCAGVQFDTVTRLLFIAAIPLACLVQLYYGYGAHAQLFEHGFIISRRGITTSGRWEDIARVTQKSQQYRILNIIPVPGTKYYNYTITLTNGKELPIYGVYFNNSQQLGDTVMRMVSKAIAARRNVGPS